MLDGRPVGSARARTSEAGPDPQTAGSTLVGEQLLVGLDVEQGLDLARVRELDANHPAGAVGLVLAARRPDLGRREEDDLAQGLLCEPGHSERRLIAVDARPVVLGVVTPVSYTHLRAHETDSYLVCRLLLE